MDFDSLKKKQREIRHGFPEGLALRVHRSLSWLAKSEQCQDDKDSQFIFLWIAFNAAYAQDTEVLRHTESEAFSKFMSKLVELDKGNHLYSLVWSEFSSCIRVLLDNQYVFQPFWDFQNGKLTEEEWVLRFSNAKASANVALSTKRTDQLNTIILQRLYTLRNQLIHGGATWNSSANRDQIRDGVAFLSKLVPIIINIMMDSSDQLWGDANYPVVNV
ncbi:HEPN domain-containing protein [Shewanella sp. 1_MG-2023]|uniref:HEPN domain-containing protein n=1 Tax=unclassified Shewanella TaxID=196818 RepID=UPI0026E15312|nr:MULTISPECIES: HEPN domain-containing protein [unclassified Shewanella]MDO6610511.1 HEPN domain-containing protein [Shewanella sp. 7_MG-2023]MDO6770636.1 HEPN domain-containing protein [Shewanella sp. 2_MG-2023]MDO6795022.1 HEPN domain-containing protein [Shewanella sp. 1_MG-2023]